VSRHSPKQKEAVRDPAYRRHVVCQKRRKQEPSKARFRRPAEYRNWTLQEPVTVVVCTSSLPKAVADEANICAGRQVSDKI